MHTDELKNVMDRVVNILLENKQHLDPQLLDQIRKIITQLESLKGNGFIPDEILDRILKAATLVVNIEDKLVNSSLTDSLISILTKLQHRPIILALIAELI